MPLAEHHGVIALRLQHFTDHDFAMRHTKCADVRIILRVVGKIDRLVRAGRLLRDHLHEERMRRREFITEARRIAPRHDRRTRRRAGRIARIALSEIDALMRNRVDIGGGNHTARDTTAIECDVVVTKIVGKDENDIRRTLAFRRCRRPLLPNDGLIWPNRVTPLRQHGEGIKRVLFHIESRTAGKNQQHGERDAAPFQKFHRRFLPPKPYPFLMDTIRVEMHASANGKTGKYRRINTLGRNQL